MIMKYWKAFLSTGLTCLLAILPTVGQEKRQPANPRVEPGQEPMFERALPPGELATPPLGDTVVFVSSEMSFEGKSVLGAPYSAQAVTESTQTLADGNRIVNKSIAAIYRDSEGRTRREQTLRGFGPFATRGTPPQMIFISDPVAGVSYSLDPNTRLARKTPVYRVEMKMPPKQTAGVKVEEDFLIERSAVPALPSPPPRAGFVGEVFEVRTPDSGGGPGGGFIFTREGGSNDKGVAEKLGTQVIEGVSADGIRTTFTIAAGEIGNERPLEIVSERWYSPELRTVVMSRHSDPRFGETVFRLTNINRSEPDRLLFEVPADYTVREEPYGPLRMKKSAPPAP